MNIENRLFRGLVIPTIILWSTVVVLPFVICWLIGEQYGFQAMFLIGAIEFTYLMCLGIIISTGIYLSVAICSYIKYRSIFIQCCGGISIYGASLGCLCILAVILGLIGPKILPLCIPITLYFLLWVKWIKQQIYISKVYWITLLTFVIFAIVPVSCVYIYLYF